MKIIKNIVEAICFTEDYICEKKKITFVSLPFNCTSKWVKGNQSQWSFKVGHIHLFVHSSHTKVKLSISSFSDNLSLLLSPDRNTQHMNEWMNEWMNEVYFLLCCTTFINEKKCQNDKYLD